MFFKNLSLITKYLSENIPLAHFNKDIDIFCQLIDGFIFATLLNKICPNTLPLNTLKDPINFDGNKANENWEFNLKKVVEKSKRLDIKELKPQLIIKKDEKVLDFLITLIKMSHISINKIMMNDWSHELLEDNECVDVMEFWDE